jgi:hypothetical protein
MGDTSLPYDTGNAGDLVKHGLLAEFTQWWCEHEGQRLRFLDPFGGRPYVSPPNAEVTRRVEALPRCALRDAQPDPGTRYYGSSYVVINAARVAKCVAEVSISDSDPEARRAFSGTEVRVLASPGFCPSDGFSILNAEVAGDLLLLDPFANFLPRQASDVIPRIAKVSERIACVLFVLNLDPNNSVGRSWRTLRSTHLSEAWSLHCPRLPNRGVVGESKYEVEVLLAWRRLTEHPAGNELAARLRSYAQLLSAVLEARIVFANGEQERT